MLQLFMSEGMTVCYHERVSQQSTDMTLQGISYFFVAADFLVWPLHATRAIKEAGTHTDVTLTI